MAEEVQDNETWHVKFREDEEMEFFTELALHETERWIQAVTRKKFFYPDDPRKSLEDGILLCELLNCLRPASVKRINKQATPIAGLDNLNVFLNSLKTHFGLQDTHLFDAADLEDLSQRAIAESDQLKQEVDRRLRNVAITVYWLGKAVSHSFQGPQLDFSAFAPLVHHHSKDIISNDHFRRDSSCSWESNEYSSAYGSHEGNSLGNIPENDNRHQRDSSYESYASYEKGSEDSLDEQAFDNMPVRYGSQSALNKCGEGMYSDDRQNSMYRSSPDLSQGLTFHRRSSSNDSLEGSYHGSHSRQSSGSNESYPTRAQRRTSSSTADPLQFVKFHRQTELAKHAEEQMKVAAAQKEQKVVTVAEKADDDWQSNLSSWKSRRKSQSSQAYQLKEELEAMEKGKEEEAKTSLQTKTFSQMQQERERRKSAGNRNFYPLEENDDDEDNDVITPSRATQQESSSSKSKLSSFKSSEVADWAQDSNSEGEEEKEDNNNNNSLSVDNENGMADDPFEEPEKSPINKPSPAKRRFGNADSDNWKQPSPERRSWDVHDCVSKENSRNSLESASKSKKISDIRNRFEQNEEQPKSRSSTVDTRMDLISRKKSFEKFEKDNSVEPSRTSDSGSSERIYSKRSATDSHSDFQLGRNNVGESVTMETRYSRSYNSDRGANKDSHTGSPSRIYDQNSTSTRNVYSSLRTSGRDYTEKNIKISQKANSEKGFGFTISGGVGTGEPITVLKVTLGSGADVCEVMAKDEIRAINKCDISNKTNQEVNQLIKDAVKSGQLELRVKRFLGSNEEEEDEELLSSDEEVESLERSRNNKQRTEDSGRDNNTSYDSRDSRTSQEDFRAAVNNNPVASALDEERQGLDQLDYTVSPQQSSQKEDKSYDSKHEEFPGDTGNIVSPQSAPDPYVSSTTDTKVETHPSITVRRERIEVITRADMEDDTKPVATFDSKYEVEMRSHRNTSENDGSSGDDFGPPAILRKWQRQRPQSEYTFEREKSPEKRLSSTLPWMENKLPADDNRTKDDLVRERAAKDFTSSLPDPPVPSPRRRFDDQKKQGEWNERQEQIRQPTHNENDSQLNQEKFQENQSRLQQDYEDDIRRAQELAKQREEQESQMLEPEMERMRLTEERRQERRMRQQQLQQSAAEPSRNNVQSYHSHEQPSQQNDNSVWSQPAESNRSTMSFQIQDHGQDEGEGRSSVLVIDPRNREDNDYNFRVNINQRESSDGHYAHQTYQSAPIDIEAIREEERRKIREEERRKREEEEERRFREKEAFLREQEEQLRQKEERLRQEQEKFHREQEELHKLRDSTEHRPNVMRFDAPVARVREASPSYQSTVTKKRPEVMRTNTAPQYSTTVVVEPKAHYTVKAVSPSAEAIRSSADPSGRSRWSREDMLAMNRKATPLQKRPDITPPTSPTSSGPIKRSLSREQVHSLNAVPKPKFRSSQDWIGGDPSMQHNPRSATSRHSEIMKKQYATPQEHWLFEEAERRRRMATQEPKPHSRPSSHTQFSGPIKPTADNRWREEPVMDRRNTPNLNTSMDRPRAEGNMPAAIRQTLLQKTAGARGSTGSNYSQDLGVSYNQYPSHGPSLTQTLPASYNFNSQSFLDQEEPLPPSTQAPPPPDHKANSSVALSGRQLCSHCNQELGFGAAMIIESLGLSYHVQCFKCCVCHTPLGNGTEGADVRVRVNKLHCPNCYSNDEAGLKFSKV